jgi:hypothetical protein
LDQSDSLEVVIGTIWSGYSLFKQMIIYVQNRNDINTNNLIL